MYKKKEILTDDIVRKVKQGNNFDFLRYLFAISLISFHFCVLTEHSQWWFIDGSKCVKAFFVMSGFLVTYSFLRRDCDVFSYFKKRFVRIVPAYVTCILFCFVLGWFITSLSTVEYLSSQKTWEYLFANIFMLNWLAPELPGTFQSNLIPVMDGSLWTMKQEVCFYALVPFILWLIKDRVWRNILCSFILILCVCTYNFVNIQTQSFMYLLMGMILLLYLDVFWQWQKILIPLAILLLIPVYIIEIPIASNLCHAVESLCFPVILIGAAYKLKPLNVFHKYDNVTYGLYLYHFPVMQTLIHYGLAERNMVQCFVITLSITLVLACASWYIIEKPLMYKAG